MIDKETFENPLREVDQQKNELVTRNSKGI